MVILLLTKETSLLAIMIKFASFASITKFDDFYAAALAENPIKAFAGKQIPFTWSRKEGEVPSEEQEKLKKLLQADKAANIQDSDTLDEQLLDSPVLNVKGTEYKPNPRNNYCLFQLLYLVYKLMRMYYVSWAYYFIPVLSLFLNLYFNKLYIPAPE